MKIPVSNTRDVAAKIAAARYDGANVDGADVNGVDVNGSKASQDRSALGNQYTQR